MMLGSAAPHWFGDPCCYREGKTTHQEPRACLWAELCPQGPETSKGYHWWYPLPNRYTSTRHALVQLSYILKVKWFSLTCPTLHATQESRIDWIQGHVIKPHWNLIGGTLCSALWVWALLRTSVMLSVFPTALGGGLDITQGSYHTVICLSMVLITLFNKLLTQKDIRFSVPYAPHTQDLSWPLFHSLWGPAPQTGPKSLERKKIYNSEAKSLVSLVKQSLWGRIARKLAPKD